MMTPGCQGPKLALVRRPHASLLRGERVHVARALKSP